MQNVIILGSGRSGTSMVTGLLSQAGYFMGENLWDAGEGNPKGYFEDVEVNAINEDILAPVTPERPDNVLGRTIWRHRPRYWQRWATFISPQQKIECPFQVVHRIQRLVAKTPFCFKDPRFCYTLAAWKPFLPQNLTHIVVFRDPLTTALSTTKEAQNAYQDLYMTTDRALKIWQAMYSHILDVHYLAGGDWLFVHYQQFLNSSSGFDRLEDKLGIKVDRNFPEQGLHRSKPLIKQPVNSATLALYERLCRLANYPVQD
ncbi:MAG: sulfotransferase [Leptolyngbyaceae cyanobacterium bins.59]|nr:sulfotransferase [Leptolyngbyaceae cyanobacterium bins.59]